MAKREMLDCTFVRKQFGMCAIVDVTGRELFVDRVTRTKRLLRAQGFTVGKDNHIVLVEKAT